MNTYTLCVHIHISLIQPSTDWHHHARMSLAFASTPLNRNTVTIQATDLFVTLELLLGALRVPIRLRLPRRLRTFLLQESLLLIGLDEIR